AAQSLSQLEQPGRVDGQELGDVRDRERRGGHGGGDLAAGTANRDPLLTAGARRTGRGAWRRAPRGGGPRAAPAPGWAPSQPPSTAPSTSSRVMRPSRPVPTRAAKSTPRSLA